jgi:hypothetical protein
MPVARQHAEEHTIFAQRQQQVGAHTAAPGDRAGDGIVE